VDRVQAKARNARSSCTTSVSATCLVRFDGVARSLATHADSRRSTAGDLLRAEQVRPGSTYGELIRNCITEGTIVPMEVTVRLLGNAMEAAITDGQTRFLIDGFPRKMDQALKFERELCPPALVLFYTTTEEVMLERLLERGKTSGRDDDNVESIQKRFGKRLCQPAHADTHER
jgi:adenylate kinase family enzyme